METQNTTVEEAQGVEHVEVEETNDTTENTIPVGQESQIAKIEEKLFLPVIPEVLNIDGVELSLPNLRNEVEQIKKMKIDGLTDEEGYNVAVEKLKTTAKLRTNSEKWRKKVMAPVLKFGKDLKGKIDETAELCQQAEKHLEEIIKPIDEYKELAKQAEELKKDELAAERGELIVACGGVLKSGTYNFEHDPARFILHDKLRSYTPEQWEIEYADIKASWDVEAKRLQDLADAKLAEENRLKTQVEDLNSERTEMRKEILEARGYALFDGKYVNSAKGITVLESQILNLSKDDWQALLNPPAKVEEESPIVRHTSGSGMLGEAMLNSTSLVETPAPTTSPFDNMVASEFDLYEPVTQPIIEEEVKISHNSYSGPSIVVPEDTIETQEEVAPKAADDISYAPSVHTGVGLVQELHFTEEKPFISFKLGTEFAIRLFPTELKDKVTEGLEIAEQGEVKPGLLFVLIGE